MIMRLISVSEGGNAHVFSHCQSPPPDLNRQPLHYK
jgi:hypothetical protein